MLKSEICILQKYTVEVSVFFDIIENMIDHNGANAKSTIRIQTAQCHYVQTSLVLWCINAAAYSTHNNVIVISQFRQFARIQNVNVKPIVVNHRENNCVQLFQLLYIMWSYIAQFYRRSIWKMIRLFRELFVCKSEFLFYIQWTLRLCLKVHHFQCIFSLFTFFCMHQLNLIEKTLADG